jgi:hypothetical protein
MPSTRHGLSTAPGLALAVAVLLIAPLFLSGSANAQTATPAPSLPLRGPGVPLMPGDLSNLEALYHTLHQNPELSLQEKKTSTRIAHELADAGFVVTDHVGGFGVVGVLANGTGPTVLVRTELDALPVAEATGLPYASVVKAKDDEGHEVAVMHACGHDVHMATLVGTARMLAAARATWSGTLVMIGQPAEERGLGAKAMLDDGLFTRFPRPQYCLALHVSPTLPGNSPQPPHAFVTPLSTTPSQSSSIPLQTSVAPGWTAALESSQSVLLAT